MGGYLREDQTFCNNGVNMRHKKLWWIKWTVSMTLQILQAREWLPLYQRHKSSPQHKQPRRYVFTKHFSEVVTTFFKAQHSLQMKRLLNGAWSDGRRAINKTTAKSSLVSQSWIGSDEKQLKLHPNYVYTFLSCPASQDIPIIKWHLKEGCMFISAVWFAVCGITW